MDGLGMRIVWTFWREKRPVQGEPIIQQRITNLREIPRVGDTFDYKGTAFRVSRVDYKRRHPYRRMHASVRLTDDLDG